MNYPLDIKPKWKRFAFGEVISGWDYDLEIGWDEFFDLLVAGFNDKDLERTFERYDIMACDTYDGWDEYAIVDFMVGLALSAQKTEQEED